ncbi:FtsK/SpoIIIE domain-containing protein [Clostridium perfringens]|uniref:FtsK/SpoIIIE domain-containing protein n=1 Tax=Clostridium perfringens TaxID=1502 RepID=UPI0028CE3B66|nr:FtsK/SpoIIIE domain-containing protein [Clostridium perfringens]MDT7988966.1 FtsK/SpoIIIE domain-containing protein [Clostridium perfringens]
MFFKRNKNNENRGYGLLNNIPERVNWCNDYLEKEDGILNLGATEKNEAVKVDLNETPHILIAGDEGVGKSVALACMIWQLKNQGTEINIIGLTDTSSVELTNFEKFTNIVRDIDSADKLLQAIVYEHTRRLNLLRKERVNNINEYNNKICESNKLPRIVIVIDEINALLYKENLSTDDIAKVNRIEHNLNTLARLARPTGINLLSATQRPEIGILSKQLINNIPVRICGSYIGPVVSELVLGNDMARKIKHMKGRFIVKIGNEFRETQLYYFNEEEYL